RDDAREEVTTESVLLTRKAFTDHFLCWRCQEEGRRKREVKSGSTDAAAERLFSCMRLTTTTRPFFRSDLSSSWDSTNWTLGLQLVVVFSRCSIYYAPPHHHTAGESGLCVYLLIRHFEIFCYGYRHRQLGLYPGPDEIPIHGMLPGSSFVVITAGKSP
ncbi:hypothetical protein E4T39_06615, partial [Aureobasidium subglaciale]